METWPLLGVELDHEIDEVVPKWVEIAAESRLFPASLICQPFLLQLCIILYHTILYLHVFEEPLSFQHFVKNQAGAPNIAVEGVTFLDKEDLWS